MAVNEKKSDEEIRNEINYQLIPMSEIPDQARLIAVRWMEGFEEWMKTDLPHKHKLASDIVNYAKAYHESEMKKKACDHIWVSSAAYKGAKVCSKGCGAYQ